MVPDVPPFEPVPLDESVPFWLEPLLELSDDDPLFPDVDPLVLLDVPLEVDESVDPLVVCRCRPWWFRRSNPWNRT